MQEFPTAGLRVDMATVYVINCREAGVDCDFEARGSSLDEVMQLCADHGIREHNMKGFGPELYAKMRRCVRVLDEGALSERTEGKRLPGSGTP